MSTSIEWRRDFQGFDYPKAEQRIHENGFKESKNKEFIQWIKETFDVELSPQYVIPYFDAWYTESTGVFNSLKSTEAVKTYCFVMRILDNSTSDEEYKILEYHKDKIVDKFKNMIEESYEVPLTKT